MPPGHSTGLSTPSAILYSAAHPAKLTGFGRPASSATTAEDVHDLAAALDRSLTGQPAGRMPPSEVIDGVDPAVDRALEHGLRGIVGAADLAEELQAAPTDPRSRERPSGLAVARARSHRGAPGRRRGDGGLRWFAHRPAPITRPVPRKPHHHGPRYPPHHSPTDHRVDHDRRRGLGGHSRGRGLRPAPR